MKRRTSSGRAATTRRACRAAARCCSRTGSVFQEGAFADGKLTGTGRQYWPSQQVLEKCKTLKKEPVLPQVQFEGSFKDGVLDGRGREFSPAGELVFAGEFKGGKYDGKGRCMNGRAT